MSIRKIAESLNLSHGTVQRIVAAKGCLKGVGLILPPVSVHPVFPKRLQATSSSSIATALLGSGTGSPSSRSPRMWNSIAPRIRFSRFVQCFPLGDATGEIRRVSAVACGFVSFEKYGVFAHVAHFNPA